MQKKSLLALLLAAMLLLSGCSLIQKDPVVDAATPIVEVLGKTVTKAEVKDQVDDYLVSLRNYYTSYYGYTPDVTDESTISAAQDAVINQIIEDTVKEAKAKELGVDQLTEEEQANIDSQWQSYYDMIKNYVYADSELEGEELEKAISDSITSYFGVTKESLTQQAVADKLKNKVIEAVANPSDDEIKAEFDKRVEDAKVNYTSNLSAYGSAVNNGDTVYYRPAGYRMVKQILTRFTDDDQSVLDNLNGKISDLDTEINTLTSSLSDVENLDDLLSKVTVNVNGVDSLIVRPVAEVAQETVATVTDLAQEAVATVTDLAQEAAETVAETAEEAVETVAETAEAAAEEAKTVVNELTAETSADFGADVEESVSTNVIALARARALKAEYETAVTTATEEAYQHIDATADDILAQLAAGADWDALMAEKGQDPGMQSGRATAETGYAVCENFSDFDANFTAAAMGLQNVGDLSEKTRGSYGYYIVKYVSDVAEGAVDLDSVKDLISGDLLKTAQDNFFTEQVAQWVKDAAAKINKNALKD